MAVPTPHFTPFLPNRVSHNEDCESSKMPNAPDLRRASYPSVVPAYTYPSLNTRHDLSPGCGCPNCEDEAYRPAPTQRAYIQPTASRNLRAPTYYHHRAANYSPRTSQPNIATRRGAYEYVFEPATTSTSRTRIPRTYQQDRFRPDPAYRTTTAAATPAPVVISQPATAPRSSQPRATPTQAKTAIQVYDFTSLLPETDSGRRFTLNVTPSTDTRGLINSLAPEGCGAKIMVRETNGETRRLSAWERVFELGRRRCSLELVDC